MLGKVCLTYLTLDDFNDNLVENYDDWEEQQLQYPFRRHAVLNWESFCNRSLEDNSLSELIHRLFEFPKKLCFLSWAQGYLVRTWAPGTVEEGKRLFDSITELVAGLTPLNLAACMH
jgi:hypothetical protein